MNHLLRALAFPSLLVALAAQEAAPPKPAAPKSPAVKSEAAKSESAKSPLAKLERVTKERLEAAYADARAACKAVLGAELTKLPVLELVTVEKLASVIAAENAPLVALREPDADKAARQIEALGKELAPFTYAKYAWSSKSFLVVPETWEKNAELLERPDLTADHALRAVMVHELSHALDDQKFDLGACLLQANTADAVTAFNAVIEGHAQLQARRVCKVRGWIDGFDSFTSSISALPKNLKDDGEGLAMLRRAAAAQIGSAYIDGERFAQAIVEARPKTGSSDIFRSPPRDADTILNPEWYLDPAKRPAVLHDPEPAIDAFVAMFDKDVWSSSRGSPTPKQLATGLTLLPKADVDAIVASLRSVRLVQLAPTAAPQSKAAIVAVMEFDSEESAKRWVALSGVLSDKKDAAMREGTMRITESKTTKLEEGAVRGLLQEKSMQIATAEFEIASIDAWRGRCVVETIYSGDPPPIAEHLKIVEDVLAAIAKKK